MKIGLILGKFMPLHRGHEHLINEGLRNCDRLHVVVCSLTREPIDGTLRFEWVKSRFKEAIKKKKMVVHHLHEDWIPQEPSECNNKDAFYGTWAGVMKALVEEDIDVFFASEDYVFPVASAIGCFAYLVDIRRLNFPISGTMVRSNPLKHWHYINEDVRKYYTKKILIIGGESTGKSTLTELLDKHYSKTYMATGIQEYARGWIDDVLDGDMGLLEYDHITMFGQSQMRLVNEAIGTYQVVFSDTDAIVSAVFQDVYYNRVSPELEDVISKEKWDLVLFLMPDVPWVDDGQRDLGNQDVRWDFSIKIAKMLDKYGLGNGTTKCIFGDFEKRFETAKKVVDNLLLQV